MKNKVKFMFDISNFEPVAEDSENKLVGGFTASISSNRVQGVETITNNCQGGNCVEGCGGGGTVNAVAGCGVKQN
ncbi:hypothetical protein [Ascidiimonas sp. W6]|uniref:hypothetical protein n=1 Tax=Ascidiimonas meishanensis TaxID=3128903 RepID=UPI0030EF0055